MAGEGAHQSEPLLRTVRRDLEDRPGLGNVVQINPTLTIDQQSGWGLFIAPCIPLPGWTPEPLLQMDHVLSQIANLILVLLSNDKNPTQSIVSLELSVAVVPEGARWICGELVEGEKRAGGYGALGHP